MTEPKETKKEIALKYSELKVSAAEFKPPSFTPTATTTTTSAADLADGIAGLDLTNDTEYYNKKDEYSYEDSCDYYSGNYNDEYNQSSSTSGPLDRDATLAVLQQNFPAYSPNALAEMYISCGSNLPATIDVLYKLENELYGVQQQQQLWQQQQQGQQQHNFKKVVEFKADDFPSLGGAGGDRKETKNSTSSSTTVLPFDANYAGRAKAAAHLPAPRPLHQPSASTRDPGSGSSSSSSAAPVWLAQGVEKFSTGISVAAEYAEARAEARDHARARNVCFENATKAYISGNKALAKELGAKGRWHNERMKMLHAQAAEEMFSKRNAATLASNNINSGGGGNSSSGALPTIDLHGLHVSEALLYIDRALEQFLEQKRVSKVRLVVGVGQHGKVPARLKMAVETHLRSSWGLKFREPYQGLLEVDLA